MSMRGEVDGPAGMLELALLLVFLVGILWGALPEGTFSIHPHTKRRWLDGFWIAMSWLILATVLLWWASLLR